MDEQQKININWSDFEMKGSSEDRFKPEVGKKYLLGFCAINPTKVQVEEDEKTPDGTIKTRKTVSAIILKIDQLNGEKVSKEWLVFAKKLMPTIRIYCEQGMVFSRLFQLEKTGTGYQTLYSLIALQDKAPHQKAPDKSKDVEALM
jgi:hypothetical protein